MADEKEAVPETAGSASSEGGGGGKVVMIVSLVNMLATIGIIGLLLVAHQKDKSRTSVDDVVSGQVKPKHAGGEGEGEHGKGEHGKGEHGGKADEDAISDSGKIIPMEPFTVNLATGIGSTPRYVRMNVSIELEQGVSDEEFGIKIPRIRDVVINLLNSKKASEITAPDGRELLKEEIKKSVNSFMMTSKVKGVYFTNFQVSQ